MKKNHRKSHVKQKKSKAIREGIGEQRGNNVPLKDNRDPYTDTMRQVNAAIAACKNEALKRGGNIWKADLVDEAVRGFLIPNLMHIESARRLLEKSIQFNMILDTLGDHGILLGACAYRLAEQLESEVPEDHHGPTRQVIQSYVDGHEMPAEFSKDVPLSLVYRDYFVRSEMSMFLQSGYWVERIRASDRNDSEKELAGSFCTVHAACTDADGDLMIFIHSCLRKAYADGFSALDVETLREFRDMYKACRDNQREVLSKSDYEHLVLMTCWLNAVLEEIEQIMVMT